MGVEIAMVPSSNAIVDPWAVMIISVNASITYTAVTTPWYPNDLAYRTQRGWLKEFHKLQEVYPVFLWFFYQSWISVHCHDKEDLIKDEHYINYPEQ
jgi:hypothetical protein